MRLSKDVTALLAEAGVSWEVRKGRKHATLWIAGRPVTAIKGSPSDRRTHKNNLARIKRAIRAAD